MLIYIMSTKARIDKSITVLYFAAPMSELLFGIYPGLGLDRDVYIYIITRER